MMKRREFLQTAGAISMAAMLAPRKILAAMSGKKPVNLLFLMTDQQRWDALTCMGNDEIKTPNLDRLAREGVLFENAYSACPVCVPARASILTGMSIHSTKVLSNGHWGAKNLPHFPTFDQILTGHGYHAEYYGKWHTPNFYAKCYHNEVKPVNRGGGPCRETSVDAFRAYLDQRCPKRPLKEGELLDGMSQRPYIPLSVDWRYGLSPEEIRAFGEKHGAGKGSRKKRNPLLSQAGVFGCLQTSKNCSLAAFEGWEALEALKRMDPARPFSLTCSFGPPHPPYVAPEPYFSMYEPQRLKTPVSIHVDESNSPHPPRKPVGPMGTNGRDPHKVREARAVYYAMITQVDEWVGKLLDTLEEKGVRDNTLVVFTSDHGDMMGDHGRFGKGNMFEGSVHIPLIMSLPGVIPSGRRIKTPVSHIDIAPTILDYLAMPTPKTDGRSLRPLINGEKDELDFAVSFWGNTRIGGPFMICDGEWKLIVYAPEKKSDKVPVNALYNLKKDPHEMNNLIGNNPQRKHYLPEAMRLKKQLETWMAQRRDPFLRHLQATSLG